MKTFRDFFEDQCHCRMGVPINGEKYEDALLRLMNCCADYMDCIAEAGKQGPKVYTHMCNSCGQLYNASVSPTCPVCKSGAYSTGEWIV